MRAGGAHIPFTTESAERVPEAVRWHVAQGKTLVEALAYFQGDAAEPNQVLAKLTKWLAVKQREARAGDLSPT